MRLNEEQAGRGRSYTIRFSLANGARKKSRSDDLDLKTLFFIQSILGNKPDSYKGASFSLISSTLTLGLMAAQKGIDRLFENNGIQDLKGTLLKIFENAGKETIPAAETIQKTSPGLPHLIFNYDS